MNNKLFSFSLGIVFLISIIVLFIMNNRKRTYIELNREKTQEIQTDLYNKDQLIKLLKYSTASSILIDNTYLNPLINLKKFNGETTPLDSVINKSCKLILRIPEKVCNYCFEEFFESLNHLEYQKLRENLIILVNSSQLKKYYSLVNKNELEVYLYGTDKIIHNEYDSNIFPYLFILDPSFKISHTFIPQNGNIDQNIDYFEKINKRYYD